MEILISGSYNAFSDGFNGAGVYIASGLLPSESFDLPIYYGSAVDLRRRIVYQHIPELTCGDHDNKPLRNYCLKHGIENVVWFLRETCKPEDTLTLEQYYLDTERPFADEGRGFNILKDTKNPFKGCKHTEETKRKLSEAAKGRTASEETKRKISRANKGKSHPHTEESKKRLSNYRKGTKASEDTRKKISDSTKGINAKPYCLKSPDGVIHEGSNLSDFAKLEGLNRRSLSDVVNGRLKSNKGWTKG